MAIEFSESDLVELQDRIENERFFAQHAGHERDHQTMAIIFIVVLLGSQLAIAGWKRYSPKTHTLFGQVALWLFPMLIGLRSRNNLYVGVWILFSLANAVIFNKAYQKPFNPSTPGLVYRWYAGVYSFSYLVGTVGYVLVIVSIFRLPETLFGITELSDAKLFAYGVITLFYGLYFGTLGRDFIMRLSDTMATSLGYYNKNGFPTKHLRESVCAVCGDSTDIPKTSDASISKTLLSWVLFQGGKLISNKAVQLECKHIYHEQCIRGWLLIGKKEVCPYCKERVDLRQFTGTNPWETTQAHTLFCKLTFKNLFLSVIDALRFLLVWNPIFFFLLHYLFIILGLH